MRSGTGAQRQLPEWLVYGALAVVITGVGLGLVHFARPVLYALVGGTLLLGLAVAGLLLLGSSVCLFGWCAKCAWCRVGLRRVRG